MGHKIGEGHFGVVFGCVDVWGNVLAAKIMKPLGRTYETVRASANAEFQKLLLLRLRIVRVHISALLVRS
jgi:hypothetical protein